MIKYDMCSSRCLLEVIQGIEEGAIDFPWQSKTKKKTLQLAGMFYVEF